MTDDEMMRILRLAADTANADCDILPAGAHQIELRDDGWCDVGWLNFPKIEMAFDVWWNPEKRIGRLWPWGKRKLHWACRPFPMQARSDQPASS